MTNIYPTSAAPTTGTFVADQVESLRAIGVDVDLLHVLRTDRGRRAYSGLGRTARQRVTASRPDIVHVMYGGVMASVVTRVVRDRPVLISYCGDDLQGGRGGGVVAELARLYGVRASHRAARRAAGIVVKSRNLLAALPQAVDRRRVWVLPNGVDLTVFRPRERNECRTILGWNPTRKHVLFPAPRDRPEKRFELALDTVAALNDSGAEIDLHDLADVRHEDVPIWLNASDSVILTSTREGSPNVVKEALACNVPVVSVDIGDVRERLDGIEGCFVAEPNVADLSDKLARVLDRGGRVEARERVAPLSLERTAARLGEIYQVVVSGMVSR